MNESQTLELQLKSTGEETLKILNKLTTSIDDIHKSIQNATTGVGKLNSSLNKIFELTGARRAMKSLMGFFDNATNRAEELNLFNVIFKNIEKDGVKTFSSLGKEATRFQYRLNEAFGTNMTETLRHQGLFQAMGENVGIPSEYAAIMSETMSKLTYDLASLYNRSEDKTAEALRGGVYAGQTKPLRNFGIDVTQTSLNPVLQSLGITDRTVNQMSQAEKEILRYIATLKQARSAMGDFAETIESPANQLKIFKQQLVEAKVAWSNLFMGMYSDLLPYANAILMVLKEIAKAIANIFGIESRDYNSGLASLEDTYNGFEDIGKGASNASKAAKELKRQILGFDQINNLTTPSNTGSGSGGGSNLSSGIDKRLLDAISGYDNLMGKVKMKATEIRDRWMEILGFKKKINPLTGEIYFEYQGLGTTVKNLVKSFGDLSAKGKLLVGLGLGVAVTKTFSAFKKLSNVIGTNGILQSSKELFNWTKLGVQVNGNLNKGIIEGIDAWRKQKGIIGENTTAFSRLTSGTKEFFKGLGIAATGFTVMNIGLDDMKEKGLSAFNSITTLGGGLVTVFGGIQAGAVFGPWGAAIGGIISSVGVLYQTIDGLGYAFDESKRNFYALQKEVDKGYNEWQESAKRLNESFNDTDSTLGYYERLYTELTNIVDENGKIKAGYEDRAKVITGELSEALGIEINIVDGVIQKYGDLKKTINDLIEQKKAMAKLNALEEAYNIAIKEQGNARKLQVEAYKLMTNAQNKFNESLKEEAKRYGVTVEELSDYMVYGKESAAIKKILSDNTNEEAANLRTAHVWHQNEINDLKDTINQYNQASKNLDNYNATIATYDKMYALSLAGNYQAMNKYFDHERFLFGKSVTEREDYWNKVISDSNVGLEILEKNQDKYTKEQYEALKKQYEDNIKLGQDYLDKLQLVMNTKNSEISNEVIDKWKKMGNKSTEEFLYFFNQLPTDAKQTLIDGLEKNKKSLSKDLQKVISDIQPTLTIDVNAKTTNANNTVNSWFTQVSNKIKSLVNSTNGGTKAFGGIFNGYSWNDIPQFANGGAPTHGTIFAAGENGAEVVGNINRRTEVLNRSQIASSIYSAVVAAMSQYSGGTTQVELIAHTDEGVVIDRINQKTKQTGRCPINIPSY
jgi:hypothetical protein